MDQSTQNQANYSIDHPATHISVHLSTFPSSLPITFMNYASPATCVFFNK